MLPVLDHAFKSSLLKEMLLLVLSVTAAMAVVGLPSTTNSLRWRSRRQSGFLCSGSKFATNLLTTIITVNKDVIKRAEPIDIGNGENMGVLSLKKGRAYNLHTVYLFGDVNTDCEDERWIKVFIPLGLESPEFVFRWELPGSLAEGLFVLSYRFVAGNLTLEIPKLKENPEDKTRLAALTIFAAQGLKFGKRGATTGLSSILATFFEGLRAVSPSVTQDLVELLFFRLFKRYLLNSELPL